MNTLDPIQLKTYLSGEFIEPTELIKIERLLSSNDKLLTAHLDLVKAAESGLSIHSSIVRFGEQIMKTRLQTIEARLDEEGFFLNEDDIYQYLEGKLQGEKLNRLEARIKQDAEFAKMLEQETGIITGLEKVGRDNTRVKLRQIMEDGAKEAKVRTLEGSPRKNRWVPLAAAAAVVLAISFWFLNPSADIQQNGSMAAFEMAEDIISEDLQDGLEAFGFADASQKEPMQKMLQAMALYEAASYTEAKALLEELSFENELENYRLLYLSNVKLGMNQTTGVDLLLKQISAERGTELWEWKLWSLARHSWALADRSETQNLLNTLIQSDGILAEDAGNLLKDIK